MTQYFSVGTGCALWRSFFSLEIISKNRKFQSEWNIHQVGYIFRNKLYESYRCLSLLFWSLAHHLFGLCLPSVLGLCFEMANREFCSLFGASRSVWNSDSPFILHSKFIPTFKVAMSFLSSVWSRNASETCSNLPNVTAASVRTDTCKNENSLGRINSISSLISHCEK